MGVVLPSQVGYGLSKKGIFVQKERTAECPFKSPSAMWDRTRAKRKPPFKIYSKAPIKSELFVVYWLLIGQCRFLSNSPNLLTEVRTIRTQLSFAHQVYIGTHAYYNLAHPIYTHGKTHTHIHTRNNVAHPISQIHRYTHMRSLSPKIHTLTHTHTAPLLTLDTDILTHAHTTTLLTLMHK